MSDSERTAPPGVFLPWDSEFFGFRIGRLSLRRLNPEQLRAALAWSVAERLRCVYFLADPGCSETLNLAHQGGFKFIDLRVDLALDLSGPSPVALGDGFRPATTADLPFLEDLGRVAHHDTRFFKDPGFPFPRATELYAEWIRRDFKLHHIFTVDRPGTGVMGYVTCQILPDRASGRIGLIAVAEAARRRGVGQALVDGALQWFRDAGCQTVRVATQASNIPAQRLYQSLGFRTAETDATFHRWF